MAYDDDGGDDRKPGEEIVRGLLNGKEAPATPDLNPLDQKVGTQTQNAVTALTTEIRGDLETERDTITEYTDAKTRAGEIVTKTESLCQQEVDAFTATTTRLFASMLLLINQIIALTTGPGAININTTALRAGAKKQSIIHCLLEILGTAGLIFASGSVSHGILGAIGESVLVPLIVIVGAVIASDFGLRSARNRQKNPSKAFWGLVIFFTITACAVYLNLLFAEYRTNLQDDSPTYLKPALFCLGMAAYALTVLVWQNVPRAAPELTELQSQIDDKGEEVDDLFAEAEEEIHSACDDGGRDLDDLSEDVRDDVREVRHAFEVCEDRHEDYLDDLTALQTQSQARINDGRAQVRASVPAGTTLPAYFDKPADCSTLTAPKFRLSKYEKLALSANADLSNVGAAVAEGINDIEQARNKAMEQLNSQRDREPSL